MAVTGTGAVSQVFQIASGEGAESPVGGGFLWPSRPNIVDFLYFLSTSVQIPPAALPATSPWPQYSLVQALLLVLRIPGRSMGQNGYIGLPPPQLPVIPADQLGILYTLACYNCATHLLLTITPDVPGQNFFAHARSNQGYGLINPSTGLVASSSDNGTSVALASPDWAKGLTIDQLDAYKTPWGRAYLSYNQKMGPTIWGLT